MSAQSEIDKMRALMRERERCLQLIEARVRRLETVAQEYGGTHPTHGQIRAAIFNLKEAAKWVSSGTEPESTEAMNPSGQLRRDRLVFGSSFELEGKRVDPTHVLLREDGTYKIQEPE